MPPKTLTLKQRLAALTQSPTSPAPQYGPEPSTPRSPGKRRFSAPWRRGSIQDGYGMQSEEDKLQEVMGRMIYQAGVDYETRPMVIMNASAMPDARDVNYDMLLSRILSYLDLYVESDYTVVFFAAGNKNTPGWNWMWKAYRSLSRKFRKNLKRLFIVHSNFFSKMLFSLAGAFISPKFFRKISYVDTLSELACSVPLTQIDVPPAVYQENLKHERQIILPMPSHASLFGVPLEDLMGFDGEKGGIPRVVKDCIQYIRESGMMEEGLFRRSPNSVLLRQVQEAYDRGHVVSLDTFGDPHLAAVLLKKYLRDLPEPLFPEALYPIIQRCPTPTDDPTDWSALLYIRDTLLPELPRCSYILLSHVLHLMHEVSLRSSTNLMDARNLTVVLCPNLVQSPSPARDVMMCAVPGAPSFSTHSPSPASPSPSANLNSPNSPLPPPPHSPVTPSLSQSAAASAPRPPQPTTLGMIIKLCIMRYYEVFDEVLDRSEALPASRVGGVVGGNGSMGSGSGNGVSVATKRASVLSNGSAKRDSRALDDDEDIDDAMLVMPIGPDAGPHENRNGGRNGNGCIEGNENGVAPSMSTPPAQFSYPYRARQRPSPLQNSNSNTYSPRHPPPSATRSLHTVISTSGPPSSYSPSSPSPHSAFGGSASRAKSTISIEKGEKHGGTWRKGSISIGRAGSTIGKSKSVGAGVEAHGITASGFFTPPPVPPLPKFDGERKD
ncbi:RhoGAP-domain-containing protein [Stereum hirsutum FP-91666 SS1]|uniref:RhoGAP-domain-containing protein n=1 Tax=Stereum hirsutum (strain FP-91666) TaxID=721885 RepID=UPI000444A3BF|nr:RhoGAP-domain-containing protein [Stereum hirsutum FP-91666 SS1]EIM81513.1 RhoGAP-domain-containing protein [Stereum hirsutum FP-91666 SS1]